MAKDRQTSWAAGEITPDLYSRGGIAGAKRLSNFLVTPQGTVINRSGSVHLATLGSQAARLVPFPFGDDEPRLVQFHARGEYAMRKPDGSYAEVGGDDTTNDTLAPIGSPLPPRATILENLRSTRVAQCAGTMMYSGLFDGLNVWLYDIRRASATSYVREAISTRPPDFGSSAVPYSSANNKRTPAIMTAATGYTIKAMAGDATHPAREWDYVVTRVVSIEDGNPDKPNQVIETLPHVLGNPYGRVTYTVDAAGVYTAASVPLEIAVYGDWNQRIEVPGAAGDPWVMDSFAGSKSGEIVAHRIYRGRNGVFGYVGETTTRYFVDDGRDPDIANPQPVGSHALLVVGSPSYPPTALAFSDDRRFCGGVLQTAQRIVGSAVGNWADFDMVTPTPDDADALSFDLAANEHQAIRHMLKGPALLAFTAKAVWAITGSGNLEVLTPSSIAARRVLSVGSAHYPAPIEGDGGVDGSGVFFFVEAKGGRPYALTADGNGAAQLTDLSLLSPHLFEGHTIVDWAWARDPHQTLWAVRDDGILLSLTYAPGMQVQAWAQHEITDGIVEAVATLPIDREDLLYMVVNRAGVLHLERLAPRIVDDSRLACHLDCATIEDLTKDFAMTVDAITGGGVDLYELEITIGSSGGLTVGHTIMFLDANGNQVQATVDAVAGTDVDATVIEYSGETLQVEAGHAVGAGAWGTFVDSDISANGLADGTVVTAVVDGAVFTDLVVGADTTGQVTLPEPGLVRMVGLPFVSQLGSLGVEQGRGKQKIVSRMHIELGRSRGGAVGTDFEHLEELPPRTVEDGYGVIEPRAETFDVPVDGETNKTADVVLEQSQPKPIKILAIEREYVLGS